MIVEQLGPVASGEDRIVREQHAEGRSGSGAGPQDRIAKARRFGLLDELNGKRQLHLQEVATESKLGWRDHDEGAGEPRSRRLVEGVMDQGSVAEQQELFGDVAAQG
jgi:hypothetical protein